MEHSFIEVSKALGKPYSFRRIRKFFWKISDLFGDEYEILYEEHQIRTITDSYQNVKDIVELLNIAYNVGVADTISMVNSSERSNEVKQIPHEEPTM